MSPPRLCRACRQGDCADCIRHAFASGGCEHLCENDVQLGLFSPAEVCRRAAPARPAADDEQ